MPGRDRAERQPAGLNTGARTAVGLDELSAHWRLAFNSAQDALRAAAVYLPAPEQRSLRAGLALERKTTAQLLDALAAEEHVQLVHRVALPRPSRRMLGLAPDVDACVFELEGVLTGAAAIHAAAWAETFDELLLRRAGTYVPFNPRTDYELYIHGRPRIEGVRTFLASRGIRLPEGLLDDPPTAQTVHGLAARKNIALQHRLVAQGVNAHAGARHYLEAVRDAGLHSAVVSASANTSAILERAGLDRLVDVRVDGGTILAERLRSWPAPDVLLAACRGLEVPPHHAAAFETLPAGVAAGHAAGFREVVAVERHGGAETMRREGADVVVRDLGELLDSALR
jgi:beta-phosphoglucomutase-like phosphatase (HAD superfamily)